LYPFIAKSLCSIISKPSSSWLQIVFSFSATLNPVSPQLFCSRFCRYRMNFKCHYLLCLSFGLLGWFTWASPAAIGQSLDRPLYMGKASTGEHLWYYGGRSQCGDLPRTDICWLNPMIVYTLGQERFTTILDCSKKVFALAISDNTGRKY